MSGFVSRRRLISGAVACGVSAPFIAKARPATPRIKLGCLTDLNGPYAAISGQGTVAAIKLAVEDFHRIQPDIAVDVVVADFSLKADVGLSILRSWFDTDGVDAIFDVPSSAVALASVSLLEAKNKVGLFTTALTSDLSRGSCGPNHLQFSSDTYKIAKSAVKAITVQGGMSWYILAPDYEFGRSMASDAAQVVTDAGGQVLGSVAFPFPTTTDFSSYLLQAQGSGAKVVCFAAGGNDVINFVKQFTEFGLGRSGTILAAPLMSESVIKGVGLEIAQGTLFPNPFYWDRDDGTRSFAKRLVAMAPDHWASINPANAYSAAFNYLKTAASLGVDTAKADGRAVVERMKMTGVDDTVFGPGKIRQNGEVLRNMLLLKVKNPAESKGPWDYCTIVQTVPADTTSRPVDRSLCKLM